MAQQKLGTALVTGASTGIGATYADRLARRGYDLVLVARDQARMETLAARLRTETGVTVEVLRTDLTNADDLRRVEARLRDDAKITLLVNNAGAAAEGGFAAPERNEQQRIIDLNITAVTHLAGAVVPRFLAAGGGSIINIASVLALAPEVFPGIYPATKSYVLAFSQGLQTELGARGLYVQAVLPAATRTEIWSRSGRDVEKLPGVMEVGDLVDAALAGFDRRELITIPPLQDESDWDKLEAQRKALRPQFLQGQPAPRYQTKKDAAA